jgi:hypothetical protein
MAFDNNMRGSLWKNERHAKDGDPDFTGSLEIDGKQYWVDAWRKKPDASAKAPALSFKIKPKEARRADRADDPISTSPQRMAPAAIDDDADIPF